MLKNARLLPDGCCCLNNTGSKLLFRINWWFVNQGFNVAPREEVHWCEVCWQWRPSHWLIPSNPKIVVSGGEMFLDLTCKVSRSPQEVWERVDMRTAHTTSSAASLLAMYQGRWMYIWTSALNWYEIQLFSRILQWFYLISKLSPTQFDSPYCCKDASSTNSSLTIYLCVGPPITTRSLGMEFFHTCIYISIQYIYTFIQYTYYF